MSDSNIPNIPDNLIPVDNLLVGEINLDLLKNAQSFEWNVPKRVIDIVEPLSNEEKFKPITDRQDKEIKILEKQIELYEVENQKLRTQLEQVNSHLRDETSKREEETAKREWAESKLTLKDWKTFLWGGVIGALGTKFIEWLFNIIPKIIELISQK